MTDETDTLIEPQKWPPPSLLPQDREGMHTDEPIMDANQSRPRRRSLDSRSCIDTPLASGISIIEGDLCSSLSLPPSCKAQTYGSRNQSTPNSRPLFMGSETIVNREISKHHEKLAKDLQRAWCSQLCLQNISRAMLLLYQGQVKKAILEDLTTASVWAGAEGLGVIMGRAKLWKAIILHHLGERDPIPELVGDALSLVGRYGDDADFFQLMKLWQHYAIQVWQYLEGQKHGKRSSNPARTGISGDNDAEQGAAWCKRVEGHLKRRIEGQNWPEDSVLTIENQADPSEQHMGVPISSENQLQMALAAVDDLNRQNEALTMENLRYKEERVLFEELVNGPLSTAASRDVNYPADCTSSAELHKDQSVAPSVEPGPITSLMGQKILGDVKYGSRHPHLPEDEQRMGSRHITPVQSESSYAHVESWRNSAAQYFPGLRPLLGTSSTVKREYDRKRDSSLTSDSLSRGWLSASHPNHSPTKGDTGILRACNADFSTSSQFHDRKNFEIGETLLRTSNHDNHKRTKATGQYVSMCTPPSKAELSKPTECDVYHEKDDGSSRRISEPLSPHTRPSRFENFNTMRPHSRASSTLTGFTADHPSARPLPLRLNAKSQRLAKSIPSPAPVMALDPKGLPFVDTLSPQKLKAELPDLETHQAQRRRSLSLVADEEFSAANTLTRQMPDGEQAVVSVAMRSNDSGMKYSVDLETRVIVSKPSNTGTGTVSLPSGHFFRTPAISNNSFGQGMSFSPLLLAKHRKSDFKGIQPSTGTLVPGTKNDGTHVYVDDANDLGLTSSSFMDEAKDGKSEQMLISEQANSRASAFNYLSRSNSRARASIKSGSSARSSPGSEAAPLTPALKSPAASGLTLSGTAESIEATQDVAKLESTLHPKYSAISEPAALRVLHSEEKANSKSSLDSQETWNGSRVSQYSIPKQSSGRGHRLPAIDTVSIRQPRKGSVPHTPSPLRTESSIAEAEPENDCPAPEEATSTELHSEAVRDSFTAKELRRFEARGLGLSGQIKKNEYKYKGEPRQTSVSSGRRSSPRLPDTGIVIPGLGSRPWKRKDYASTTSDLQQHKAWPRLQVSRQNTRQYVQDENAGIVDWHKRTRDISGVPNTERCAISHEMEVSTASFASTHLQGPANNSDAKRTSFTSPVNDQDGQSIAQDEPHNDQMRSIYEQIAEEDYGAITPDSPIQPRPLDHDSDVSKTPSVTEESPSTSPPSGYIESAYSRNDGTNVDIRNPTAQNTARNDKHQTISDTQQQIVAPAAPAPGMKDRPESSDPIQAKDAKKQLPRSVADSLADSKPSQESVRQEKNVDIGQGRSSSTF